MKRFSFVFFCIILSICSLVTSSNEDYLWQRANVNDMVSDMEGNILSVQRYLNSQENYAGTERRSMPPKSCLKNGASQEAQLEQPVVSSPSRRSSTLQSERNPSIHFESISQPVLRYEKNKFSRTDNEEPLHSQVTSAEDGNSENQVPLEEPSSTPNENLVEDIIIEITEPIPETTTPVNFNEILSDQEIVAPVLESEESNRSNLYDNKKQLMSSTSVPDESPVLQTECSDKSKVDDLTKPPRRFLAPMSYDIQSQQNKIVNTKSAPRTNNNKVVDSYMKNNLITNNNDIVNENVDASTIKDKSPTNKQKIYKFQNLEKSLQQTNENMAGLSGTIHYMYNSNSYTKVRDPTKGEGISYVNKSTKMNLVDLERVCYACSTANNPTCWLPDRKTTVKYCRKRDNACVTKTYGSGSTFILTRDCGKTCDEGETPGLNPKYQTCSICHEDLCNGSHSIKVYSSMLVLPTIVLIILVKPLLVFS